MGDASPEKNVPLAHLHRYRDLVDDFEAFMAAADRPLDRVVWANTRRVSAQAVERVVQGRCPEAKALTWREGAWRLPPDARPGKWPEYLTGWLHGQEEAALWAVDVLDPQPGERVLDLCAAPGNKTAQIALAMQGRGTLVANERRFDRLSALRRTLDRLGMTSAVVTHEDGLTFPELPGGYDRVLADVPCTCEGTSRKAEGRRRKGAEGHRRWVVGVQRGLLRRALKLVKPGGVVVYATCTYAPEENEGVLDGIDPSVAVIEPVTPPEGLTVTPGILDWGSDRYRPDVVHGMRMWPHHNDTGGFFVARLRRL